MTIQLTDKNLIVLAIIFCLTFGIIGYGLAKHDEMRYEAEIEKLKYQVEMTKYIAIIVTWGE